MDAACMGLSARSAASLWAWCAGLSAALLVGVACTEPSFVSLGGNVARAALAIDAGVRDASPAADVADTADAVPLRNCGDEALRVPITSTCEARASVDCPPLGAAQYAADDLLSTLLRECRALDNLLWVRFGDSGCAVGFGLDPNASSTTPDVEACVANRLATERYACAEGLACGRGTSFLVPAR